MNSSLDGTLAGTTASVSHRGLLVVGSVTGLLLYLAIYGALWPQAPTVSSDTIDYLDFAERLVNGTWNGPHDRMIGYPLLLIPFGGATQSIGRSLFYFQLLAHLVGVVALASVLRRLGASAGLCAGFVALLLLPPFVDEAGTILTECLTGTLMAGMVYGLVRWQTDRSPGFLWLAGCLGATAFLFRPVYLLFGAATAIAWLLLGNSRAMIRAALPLVVPSVLVVSTMVGIHAWRFGYTGLTPKSGFMLFSRTVNVLERIPDEQAELREMLIRHRDRSMTERGSSHSGVTFMWGDDGALSELLATTGKSTIELSEEMSRINMRLIAGAPLEYLSRVSHSIAESFFPATGDLSIFGSRALQLLWSAVHFLIVGAYMLTFCYFVADWTVWMVSGSSLAPSSSLHPSTRLVEVVLHLSVWYTCLLSSAVEVGSPRFMRPVMPMAIMTIVLFVSRWKDWRREAHATALRSPRS